MYKRTRHGSSYLDSCIHPLQSSDLRMSSQEVYVPLYLVHAATAGSHRWPFQSQVRSGRPSPVFPYLLIVHSTRERVQDLSFSTSIYDELCLRAGPLPLLCRSSYKQISEAWGRVLKVSEDCIKSTKIVYRKGPSFDIQGRKRLLREGKEKKKTSWCGREPVRRSSR